MLLIKLTVISEGNPCIDYIRRALQRAVVIPVLAVEGEGADVRSVMQLGSDALNVLVLSMLKERLSSPSYVNKVHWISLRIIETSDRARFLIC